MKDIIMRIAVTHRIPAQTLDIRSGRPLCPLRKPQKHRNFFLLIRSNPVRNTVQINVILTQRFAMVGNIQQRAVILRKLLQYVNHF